MFEEIFEHKILASDDIVSVGGLNSKVQASYVWNLFNVSNKNILVVTSNLFEANQLYKALVYKNNNAVLFFPMDDFLVSESLAISPDLMVKRIETLNELLKEDKKIIITNLLGYLRFLPCKTLWKNSKINLKINESVDRNKIIQNLIMLGYKKESLVTKTGEFANRGYILDIFPFENDVPVRIEFFDDEIEEIRLFDPNDQRSLEKIEQVEISSFTEFINEKKIKDIPENRQSLLPRVVNEVSKLSDYILEPITLFFDIERIRLNYNNVLAQVFEFSQTDIFKLDKYMHDINDIIPEKYVDIMQTDNYIINTLKEIYKTEEIPLFNSNYELLNIYLSKRLSENKKIIVYLDSDSMIEEFKSKIKFNSILTNEKQIYSNIINIIKRKEYNGFIINNLVLLTENEIYRRNNTINYKSKFKYGSKIKDINKLSVGDYIVHSSFGIGKYLGIVTLTTKGLKKDYIYLQYKDDDKLYIPVEKIEYISKYSSNEGIMPRLSKLGGTDWVKQKSRVKGKVAEIAKELLMNSAKRKLIKGFEFLEDDEDQYKFESVFSYDETKDQLRSIKEIKEDMMLPYPMDRLLCGDVGYGKTEVAFRAIFKAIKSGKQVAFLCPTTILSKQHYENAMERFNGFGVNIAVLNRFITPKEKDKILDELKSGKIDLIIGTHRLLSKDIIYKDLGLLVIDEEQRFGVSHKEKIKAYKENIDVLTLSATPIPRTLQMSLSGIRGLSLIETPPAFRYPVQTYVLRENNQIIKDAIYKELSRDGQIFVLYNNVAKIDEKVSLIKKLVPEANVCYVHGQMNKNDIEQTMEKFINQEYNVLVCTTIIETGIDIENANTLIVFDADHFGLSQLYQIRGRIGRGKNIGYAYLMYKQNKELNEIATKRLNAIKEFTELGSGYALAMRDLSIRGAGNILGSEQSGFIDTIGYDMYLKILNEEVEKLKGNLVEEEEKNPLEKPFIQVDTHISDKYSEEEDLKIQIHKMINNIDSIEKYEEVKKEFKDRFGYLDETIINYMLEELFEVLSRRKGVIKVEQKTNEIILYFSREKSSSINGAKLLVDLFNITPNFTINYTNNILRITLNLKKLEKHFVHYLVEMINVVE